MPGEYFDPTPVPEHRCGLPALSAFREHDGWRCECGRAYTIERLSPRDTNPGELPYQWRRSPGHDSVPHPGEPTMNLLVNERTQRP